MSNKFDFDPMWSQEEAIRVCRAVEEFAPKYGCHVALTGGCLYKDGPRKDLDLLFYRIRQCDGINTKRLFKAMEKIGIRKKSGFGWCYKCEAGGKSIDCFFPEEEGGGACGSIR